MTTRPLSKREREESNPRFNDSRMTATVTAPPPFSFPRSNLHYFPVRADLATLQVFCDNYLNAASDFAYFKPAMPFVLVLVNYYPKMGYAEGNLGWVSQNEVLFVVPLEWYEPGENGWAFKNFAQFSPFAFVDKDASQIEGREVYGWPKVEGWFASSVNPWVEDPRARRTVLELHTHGFQALYADQYDQTLPLLKITQNPPLSFTAFPPEIGGPLDPLTNLAQGMNEMSQLMRTGIDWMGKQLLAALSGEGDVGSNMLTDVQNRIRALTTMLMGNTVNFKQIRDAEDPGTACYQAVTNAVMQVTEIRRGGMLGDLAMLRGDLSGGYELELCNYPSIPIIDSLGLEVSKRPTDGSVHTLQPVLPFWQELNLKYLTGENIAWRAWDGHHALWRNDERIEVPTSESASREPKYLRRPPYMTEAGANFQVAEGPFQLPGASLIVLPLRADPEALRAFLQDGATDSILEDDTLPSAFIPKSLLSQVPRGIGYFEPWGNYVYMVVAHFQKIQSERNDFGTLKENQVFFALPVKLCRGEGDSKEVLSAGYISPYMYSTNDIAATTGRELSGYTTVRAGIESAPNTWLTEEGPLSDHQPLFNIHAEMPAALTGGQQFEWRKLLEVIEGNSIAWDDSAGWQSAMPFVERVKDDAQRMQAAQQVGSKAFKDFLSMALSTYCGSPINQFSFKQFRDTSDPLNACYQAVVRSQFVIDRVYHQQDLEKRLHVNIYRFPTQPIVESLGLDVKSVHDTDEGTYDCLQPIRPFYLRADLHTQGGLNLTMRAGSHHWSPLCLEPDAPDTRYGVGRRAVKWMRRNPNAQLLKEKRLATQLAEDPDAVGLSQSAMAALLRTDFEPQMAINCALSQEWGNDRVPRWYLAQQRQRLIGHLHQQIAALEAAEDEASRAHRDVLILRAQYLTTFPVQQLPDYILRCDTAGMEQERLFPHACRVSGEEDPEYWTPDSQRWNVPEHQPDAAGSDDTP